jgi:G:T-mismatch repair DNA endonuclease (very short patch repair protein)
VIEFYGDFWHDNPLYYWSAYLVNIPTTPGVFAKDIWSKDRIRIDTPKNLGHNVLIIWETDWKQRKEECIEKIKEFL